MSDQQADQSDRVKPWTIKNVSPEARNAAIAAAEREKKDLGPWIGAAILRTIKTDRETDRSPVPLAAPEVRPSDPGTTSELVELAALARLTAEARQKPLSRTMAALLDKAVRDRVMALSGQTPIALRSDPGPV